MVLYLISIITQDKKIKDLNLEKSVICLEPTFSSFDKEKIFKSADGFILPSKSENLIS